MRRHAVLEDTRDEILAALDKVGRDRTEGAHPRLDKARRIAQALHAIEAGAVEVRVEHTVYRVVGEERPRQYLITEDSPAGVLETLRSYGDKASGERAQEYAQAIEAIGHGALAVFAGGEMYRLVAED